MPDKAIKVQYEGRQIPLEFDADKPILHLKEMLHDQTGLPIQQIKIYYSGPNREFDDDKTLRHYGLQFGAFFHMSDRTKDPTPQKSRRVSTPVLSHAVDDDFETTTPKKVQQQQQQQQQQRRNTTIALPSSSSSSKASPTNMATTQEENKYSEEEELKQKLEAQKQAEIAKQQIAAKKAAKKLKQKIHARKSVSLPLQLPEETADAVEKIKKSKAAANRTKTSTSPKRATLPATLPPASPPTSITIDVKTPNNGDKIIPFEVEPTTDTFEILQEKIAKEFGIPIPIQILKNTVSGQELPATYSNKPIQELLEFLQEEEGMTETTTRPQLTVEIQKIPITVRTSNNNGSPKEIQLLVDPTKGTIEDLKKQLEKESGIPVENQNLSLQGGGGELLLGEDQKLAIDCGIEAGSVLDLQPKSITVEVVSPTGETVKIETKPTDTTESLREKIAKEVGVAIPYQDLTFDGGKSVPKNNNKTLSDMGIKDGSVVKVGIRKIPVTVRTDSGKEINVLVDPSKDTIADLKRQLESESGIPVDNQNLSLEGSELGEDSNQKLAIDCGIEAGSVLDLQPKTIAIEVVTPTGEMIKIEAKPTDTTKSLQEKIAKQVGVAIPYQDLSFDGKSIPKDTSTLLNGIGIKDGSVVKVGIRKLPVTVRTNSGKELQLLVDPTKDSIADMKQQLEKESGIPVDNQNLSFEGNELKDSEKLAVDCGIKAGSVLDLEPKTITIDVVSPTGEKVKIKAKPTDTTESLQERIAKEVGVAIPHQDLTFDGNKIPKGKTIGDVGIKDGSVVKVGVQKMPITVRTNNGQEVKLMVDPTKDTIADLKQQLEKESGIPVDNQNLSLEGNELKDSEKLAIDCGIKAGSVLDLEPKTITIDVVSPTGETVKIEAKATDTTESLQERIAKEVGIDIPHQDLTFDGKRIPKDKTIGDVGIKNGSVVKVGIQKMPVTVRTNNGKEIQLMVDPTKDTIEDLKQQLEKESSIPAENQNLSLEGNELEDSKKRAIDCGIVAGSVLDLEPKTRTLVVNSPTGKKFTIEVQPTDTTEAIKGMIEKETGLPILQQTLKDSNGSDLEKDRTIEEMGLHDGSELSVGTVEVPVTVRTNTGKEITLMVDPSQDTIADMKKKLEREAGIPSNNQKLSLEGNELETPSKLAGSCGIQQGTVLDLAPKTMTIHVKTPDGKTISIQVEPSYTSRSIKEKLVREAGIPITQQVLEVKGKTFPNFKTVKDMRLQDGSELSVAVLKIPVTVRTLDGKEIELMVNPADDCISDLKKELESASGVPASSQRLSMLGIELSDPDRTAGDCGILSGSVLDLEPQTITVGVKTPSGKTITVAVQPSDPIESIKERIAMEAGIDVPQQVLKLNGSELVDSNTVEDCGIKSGSLLDLSPKMMTIAVQTPDNDTIKINVKPSDTTEAIKEMVAKETGIESSQQVLSFNDAELAESATLDEIGAKDNSVLMLQRAQVPVTVNIPDGKQVNLVLDPTDTIEGLKEKLEVESGIPRDEQKISVDGTELDDPRKTIQECNIKPGSFLELERKRLEATAENQAKRLEEQQKQAAAARDRRASQKPVEEPKPELSEERKRKCYMWYARMAQPDRESMIRRVKQLDKSCDITVEDVEALPWLCGGLMLPVKEMNDLFMNG